jgi:hypothetical protein
MRSFSERRLSLPLRVFDELGLEESPAEPGPDHSPQSVRTALMLFFAIAIALAMSVAVLGRWMSANSPDTVRFPPAEWGSHPPLWID